MQITLDGVELPELEFVERFTETNIDSRVSMSLGGVPMIWEQKSYGRPITLQGGEYTGIMSRETLLSLQSMASAIGSDAIYTLSYDSEEFNVRFRNEEIAIEATPIVSFLNTKYKNVIIRLQEV